MRSPTKKSRVRSPSRMKPPGPTGSCRSPTTASASRTACFAQGKSGLGTGIIKALAQQLDAKVATLTGPKGTTVSITHATFRRRQFAPRDGAKFRWRSHVRCPIYGHHPQILALVTESTGSAPALAGPPCQANRPIPFCAPDAGRRRGSSESSRTGPATTSRHSSVRSASTSTRWSSKPPGPHERKSAGSLRALRRLGSFSRERMRRVPRQGLSHDPGPQNSSRTGQAEALMPQSLLQAPSPCREPEN